MGTITPHRPARFKRRWSKFSIRSLLTATTVIAISLGVFMYHVRVQQRAVNEIQQVGGRVAYEPNWLGCTLPGAMQEALGEDACGNVHSVSLRKRTLNRKMVTPTHAELERAVRSISRLRHVRQLSLHTLRLQDVDIELFALIKCDVEELAINELFHGKLRGSNLGHLAGLTQLRSLTLLSSGLNETLDLEPLASLPNLTALRIGTGELKEKDFADISRIKSLDTLSMFGCNFDGVWLQHLHKMPNLKVMCLDNIYPEVASQSYAIDEAGSYQPINKPAFRFRRWFDHGMNGPQKGFPAAKYQEWLNEVLPKVQVSSMYTS